MIGGTIALLVFGAAGCQVTPQPFGMGSEGHTVQMPNSPQIANINAVVNIPALDPKSPPPPDPGPRPYKEGHMVSITARAVDPAGGAFTYAWSTSGGKLLETSGSSTTWLPPNRTGSYDVTVTATTERGCRITDKLAINLEEEEIVIPPYRPHSTVSCP